MIGQPTARIATPLSPYHCALSMGINVLDDAIEKVGYRHGFEKGYRIELDRLAFLKKYTIGQINSKLNGWLRKYYEKLFNRPPWEKD